jgi:cyclohexadieny/prephenate dehydrogenase
MSFEHVAIVGVGLIGGSVGLAAKARGAARRVTGIDRDPQAIAKALARGAIDGGARDLADGVRDAGLVVVCTPVDRIAGVILEAASDCRPGTLFTDGGSTKANIAEAVDGKLPAGIDYVPAHPLAGSEKSSADHAAADLFANRTVILTPLAGTAAASIDRVGRFWQGLGARLTAMNPHDHDRLLAVTSHLPHAVAATVAGMTPMAALPLTAGGFRDVTRIAAGDPRMWAAIFQANRDPVLAALAAFSDRLAEFRALLEAGDGPGLIRWLTEAKRVRDALGC